MDGQFHMLFFLTLGCLLRSAVRVHEVTADSEEDEGNPEYTLEAVMAIWRHGNRTPIFNFPMQIDQYLDTFQPFEFGMLTPRGRKQSAILGEMLASRYSDLLPPFFSYKAAEIRCSEYKRAIETAMVAMANVWPAVGPQKWDDSGLGALWTPIPCTSKPLFDDPEYETLTYFCPRLVELLVEILNSPEFIARSAALTYYGLVNLFVAQHERMLLVDDPTLYIFYDSIAAQEGDGVPAPDWVNPVYPYPLRDFYGLAISIFTWNQEITRLAIGGFVQQILNVGTMLEEGLLIPDDRVFFGYSFHDIQVAPLLKAFRLIGQDETPAPPFGSVLLVEWHRDMNTSKLGARFLYQNESWNEPMVMSVPGCDEICPLTHLLKMTADIAATLPMDAYCNPVGDPVKGHNLTAEHFEQYLSFIRLWYDDNTIAAYRRQATRFLSTSAKQTSIAR